MLDFATLKRYTFNRQSERLAFLCLQKSIYTVQRELGNPDNTYKARLCIYSSISNTGTADGRSEDGGNHADH